MREFASNPGRQIGVACRPPAGAACSDPSRLHRSNVVSASARVFVLVLFMVAAGCGEGSEKSDLSDPTSSAYFERAQEALSVGGFGFALMLADSVAAREPEFSGAHFLRGQIFTEMERYDEAASAFERAAMLDPDNVAVKFNLANNAYRREQYREALRRYDEILDAIRGSGEVRIYEEDPRGERARYAVLVQMGRTYAQLGVADSARNRFEEAIAARPKDADAYKALSEILEGEGKFDEALKNVSRAREIDPANLDYKFGKGSLLMRSGHYEEAVPLLQDVVEKRPYHQGAHYNLGQALVRVGRGDEAQTHLAKADSLQKLQSEIDRRADRARANPDNPQSWVEFAQVLRSVGRFGDAKKALTRALDLVPGHIPLQNNIAILAAENGDTTEAIYRYRAILQQDSTLADVWLNLGTIYAETGRIENAREAWRKALYFDPDDPTAQAYLTRYGRD